MTTFTETHKDILDDITREANRPGTKVTVSISIDGGRPGVFKFDAPVTPGYDDPADRLYKRAGTGLPPGSVNRAGLP